MRELSEEAEQAARRLLPLAERKPFTALQVPHPLNGPGPLVAAVNQQPPLSAAVDGPHGLTPNNTKAHYRARSGRPREHARAPLSARRQALCVTGMGWLSPWQRECWPWQVPREQLVGSGRLVSKQIYRQSSTTRPLNRGGNDKAAIRVEDNKEGIVGQRRESDSQRPFPTGPARSRRGRQNRVGEAPPPPPLLKSFKWGDLMRFARFSLKETTVFCFFFTRRIQKGHAGDGLARAGRSFEAGRGLKMSLKLSQK